MGCQSMEHSSGRADSRKRLGLSIFDYECFEAERQIENCAEHSYEFIYSRHHDLHLYLWLLFDLWRGESLSTFCKAFSFSKLNFNYFPEMVDSDYSYHSKSFYFVDSSYSYLIPLLNCL